MPQQRTPEQQRIDDLEAALLRVTADRDKQGDLGRALQEKLRARISEHEEDVNKLKLLRSEREREACSKLTLASALAETQNELFNLQKHLSSTERDYQQLKERSERAATLLREATFAISSQAERLRDLEQRVVSQPDAPHSTAKRRNIHTAWHALVDYLGDRRPKHKTQIEHVLSIPGNAVCADCLTQTVLPTHVSTAYGCLLCPHCAAVHRKLAHEQHNSEGLQMAHDRVLSLVADPWTDRELAHLAALGNLKCNAKYLGELPKDFTVPVDEEDFVKFIHDKYVHGRWQQGHDDLGLSYGYGQQEGASWLDSALHRLSQLVNPDEFESPRPVVKVANFEPEKEFIPSVTAWFDQKDEFDHPLVPVLRELVDKELTLGPHHRAVVARLLPFAHRRQNWVRVFSTEQHGHSLRTLYHECHDKGPNVLLVKTVDGSLLGGFSTEGWGAQQRYHGTGETLVFRFKRTRLDVLPSEEECIECEEHPPAKGQVVEPEEASSPAGSDTVHYIELCEHWCWSGGNEYFTLSHAGMLAFGGGTGPALCIDSTLGRGSTSECETFGSPPLLHPTDFIIARLEVFALGEVKNDAEA